MFFTWSQPISLIFFPVLFKPNCFVISARFPGLSANEVKSDSQPGASSPVIDRCITTIPALSSSAASILWDFSRASVDKSIWHLSIITIKSQLDNVITWHNYMTNTYYIYRNSSSQIFSPRTNNNISASLEGSQSMTSNKSPWDIETCFMLVNDELNQVYFASPHQCKMTE